VNSQQKKAAAAEDRSEQGLDRDDLKAHGEKVYAQNCVACHQATGMGVPGAFPALSGSKVVDGPKEEQIKLVLNGKQGTAMNAFKHLSDVELAAVVTYTRNSWNNKTGDTVAPADVKAAAVNRYATNTGSRRQQWKQHTHTVTTITPHGHPTGIMRWVKSTNHKDIGTMYLWFSFTMFLVGGVMALIIRSELFQPGLQMCIRTSSTR
jgi:mono/diheme cytochrome c family protein